MVFGGRHAVGEGDGEGVECWLPACHPSCLTGAFGVQASGDEVEGFQGGLLVGEVAAGADGPSEAGVQRFDRVSEVFWIVVGYLRDGVERRQGRAWVYLAEMGLWHAYSGSVRMSDFEPEWAVQLPS